MYDNVKHLGMPLKWWRDEVFHGMFNLGELYQMMKDGVDFNAIALCPSNIDIRYE